MATESGPISANGSQLARMTEDVVMQEFMCVSSISVERFSQGPVGCDSGVARQPPPHLRQLNTGYHRSGKSTVCIGQGSKIEARDFSCAGSTSTSF
jgi:hypothetical protein